MKAIKNKYDRPENLVETDWLEQNLNAADLRIFDCTVNVEINLNPASDSGQHRPFIYKSGRDNYQQAHIPRAGFIDVPGELSDMSTSLPLMMPPEEQFVEMMGRYGIADSTHVVLYGSTEPNWAARVWWMLHSFGFDNVAILNGGWNKWSKEGRPVSNEPSSYDPGKFSSRPRVDSFVDKDEVLAAIGNTEICTINALPSPLHDGSSEIFFGRKGRISDSVNLPFGRLHDGDTGNYLAADELRKLFDEVHASTAERVIAYCGGGIASANTAFALNLLGYDNIAVYDGSMLEWGNDPSLPMETG